MSLLAFTQREVTAFTDNPSLQTSADTWIDLPINEPLLVVRNPHFLDRDRYVRALSRHGLVYVDRYALGDEKRSFRPAKLSI